MTSRNNGEKEAGRLISTVIFLQKANPLRRITVLRDGMSVCEDRVIRNTLQSDEARIHESITNITVFSSK